ncbi:phage recombination protein Bet [Uliginosibacterium sp. sgz301328]|uniref:phage recombination protein Bet n=1 Tax=Uliginosibacterium sp. sgz301328 TaxID=3243764 RepID=UPI00359D8470
MSNIVLHQVGALAEKMGLQVEARDLVDVLKATAFKGQVNDAQMSALLIVANQYGLNPWTKEIYAFPDKNNGIVPVVGVDGWARIINEHAQFDGMEFDQDDKSCTCVMYRKDRSHAIKVTEYMDECKRGTQPWGSHPRRMLRHKAMIQCARLAFGFGGIYDEDEAERIKDMGPAEVVSSRPARAADLPIYPEDQFVKNLDAWRTAVQSGKATTEQVINKLSTKYTLDDEQKAVIRALTEPDTQSHIDDDGVIDAEFVAAIESAEENN